MPVTSVITKIVAYYRLSKPKKGKNKEQTIRDAYGLEDQRREVAKIAEYHGAKIIAEFQEIETGTNKKACREQLQRAIRMCRMHKAILVIGKQDRLARNVAFVANLMEAGVEFMCADRPQQTKTETHFRAMMDEEETNRISARTKAGLAIAKEKGVLLGSARPGHWKGREHLRGFKQAAAASALARTQRAKEAYEYLFEDIIRPLNQDGVPLDVIAERLNELGHVTMAGTPFYKGVVHRVFKLFGQTPRPEERFMGECLTCGRRFQVSWKQRKAHEEEGHPYICYRCAKQGKRQTDTKKLASA